nr:hypothetical protein Iba_chr12dCG13010 [Ipomoea batatas]
MRLSDQLVELVLPLETSDRRLPERSRLTILLRFENMLSSTVPLKLLDDKSRENKFLCFESEMREVEESAIGINYSLKKTATEIKLNHLACGLVTRNSIPQAAINATIPRNGFWIGILDTLIGIMIRKQRKLKRGDTVLQIARRGLEEVGYSFA